MNGFGGDGIGSTATDAGNIITGKDNVQVVTTMDKRPHDDTNDLWRAVQRIETNVMSLGNKLDLALSEQGRLSQNGQSVTQQLSMSVQQQVQLATQVAALTTAVAQIERRLAILESRGFSRTDWLLLAILGCGALASLISIMWMYR